MFNRKSFTLTCIFLLVVIMVNAQELTYYDDIQPIIYKHCVSCHQPGESGPFNLLTYEDLANRSRMIQYVIGNRYMPPWQADSDYRHYLNERIMSDEEISKIGEWVKQGKHKGVRNEARGIELKANKKQVPDLSLPMNLTYEIPPRGTDDFRFFHIPTGLSEDTYLKAIEFVPGNRRYVHHSRLMADTTNDIAGINGMSELDPNVYKYQSVPLADDFLYGWVPGNFPVFFPDGVGKKLFANTDIILNIHYAPSATPQTDLSTVNLYYTDKKVKREVATLIIRENDIINQPFYLPANRISKFSMKSDTLKKDISLISVMPHMHYLGKDFLSYAVTQSQDTIPLIRIPAWDFNWQTMYQFEHYVKIPKGSVIYGFATYDNTMDNPVNQYFPPRDVGYGWRTVDEMMNLVFYYVRYQKGDEKHYFKK